MASVAHLERSLDRLHARARALPALHRFTTCTRILLAVGFVPPALVKVQGERFTTMGIDTPVGFFFEAMYRTGAYWQFIGWAQVIAGLLLLVPATATLGAVLCFPIVLNIFVVTVALQFTGTPAVTGLMLLAVTYLLCWDYHRWKALLPGFSAPVEVPEPRRHGPRTAGERLERGAYVVGTVAGMAVFGATRGYLPTREMLFAFLALGFAAMVALAAAWAMQLREHVREARTVPSGARVAAG
jgi:hypothetical protein